MRSFLQHMKAMAPLLMPLPALVLVTHLFWTPLPGSLLARFVTGTVLVLVGLACFQQGMTSGMGRIGQGMGQGLARLKPAWGLLLAALLLGFVILVADPDAHLMVEQVLPVFGDGLSGTSILMVMALGAALVLGAGLLRLRHNIPFNRWLPVVYVGLFLLALLAGTGETALSFNLSGAAYGALTAPFLMALGLGFSPAGRDRFGLVGLASAGATAALLVLFSLARPDLAPVLPALPDQAMTGFITPLAHSAAWVFFDVLSALAPLVILLIFFKQKPLRLSEEDSKAAALGLTWTLAGLLLVLVGLDAGFGDVGRQMGRQLAASDRPVVLYLLACCAGAFALAAQPAVHVLVGFLQDATSRRLNRWLLWSLLAGSSGLAVSLALFCIRQPAVQSWHLLLPGYALSVLLAAKGSSLTGLALDTGALLAGPAALLFLGPFLTELAAGAGDGLLLATRGGLMAFMALLPLLAVQLLGLWLDHRPKQAPPDRT